VAIFLSILITVACGITAGIFLGGFWWVVFGLLFGALESIILFKEKIFDDDTSIEIGRQNSFEIIMYMAFIILAILGGILFGKIIGGFWWVLLGLVIGFFVGIIIVVAYDCGGKMLAALLQLFIPTGAFLALYFIDWHWLVALLGCVAGGLASMVLSFPHIIWHVKEEKIKAFKREEEEKRQEEENRRKEEEKKRLKAEKKRLKEEEAERLRLEYEERERREQEERMLEAPHLFPQLKRQYGRLPDKLYKDFCGVQGGDDVFNFHFKEDISGVGVEEALERYKSLVEIANYFSVWCYNEAFKAKQESDKFNAYREKAVILASRLKEIWEHLTKKQKERNIEDAWEKTNFDMDSITVTDSLRNIVISPVIFDAGSLGSTAWDNFSELLDGFNVISSPKYKGDKGEAALALIGVELVKTVGAGLFHLFNYALDKLEQSKRQKRQIEYKLNRLHDQILSMYEERLKIVAFCKQASKMNMTLEEAMERYEKEFEKTYAMLFPAGDTSKSKNARNENKKNGGNYFNEEEAMDVLHLCAIGQFILNLADIKL